MVGHRAAGFAAALLLTSLLIATPATAQEPEFLLLGEDATGDAATADGVPMIDTMADINGLSVATVENEVVFHLGMQGTTTEAGEFCFLVHFKHDGTDYIGFDCFDCAAYECTNAATPVYETVLGNSRGDDIAAGATLLEGAVEFRFLLDDFGAAVGDTVEDIYGLVYLTRGLEVVDVLPDAKRDREAPEALGPYRLGGPVGDAGAAVQAVFENLTTPAFLHEFTNATSDDYTLNFTVPWSNATIDQTAAVVSGSANVTVYRDGEVFMAFLLTNQTAPAAPAAPADDADGNATDGNVTDDGAGTDAPVLRDVAGNWSVVIDYEGFVGSVGLELSEHVLAPEPKVDDNVTDEPSLGANAEDAPGPALPLLVLAVLAVVVVVRRRD